MCIRDRVRGTRDAPSFSSWRGTRRREDDVRSGPLGRREHLGGELPGCHRAQLEGVQARAAQ
eukprot:14729772-Alexandrium_andersonii.AAC.1